jgi:opacity protein-like surface antigen
MRSTLSGLGVVPVSALRRGGLAAAVAAFLIQGFLAGQARCEDYDIIPSLSVKQEYSDNLFFSSGSKTHSFTTALSPRLELAHKDERTDASLLAGMDWFVYWDTSDVITAFNQQYRGRLSHRVSETLRINLDAGYTVNNQPDEDLTKDGVVIDALKRYRQSYSGGVDVALSERSAASVSYLYQQEEYPGLPTADNSVHSVGFGYEYDLRDLLPAATGRFNSGYDRYGVSDSTTDNVSATVGMGFSFSETWKLTADVGGRFSNADYDVVTLEPTDVPGYFYPKTVRESRDSWGWVARAALSVRGEVDTGSLTFNRNVGLSSSRNGTSENTSVDLSYRRSLSDRFFASVSTGYQYSRSGNEDLSSSRIDEDYIRFNAGLRYEFDKHMAIDASYSYLKAFYHQSDTSAERNSVMVSFTIRHPLLDRW